MIGEVIFETLIPFIMGLIINNGINGNNGKGDTNYIVMMGVIMFVFALLGLVAGMGEELQVQKLQQDLLKICVKQCLEIFRHFHLQILTNLVHQDL